MTEYTVDDVLDMNNYSINQIDDYFMKNEITVVIYGGSRYVYGNKGNKWSVKLEKMDDGIELKIETVAPTLYAAMYDAYEKFNQVAKRGAPNLLTPVIDLKPMTLEEHETKQEKALDDDIPF